MSDPNDGGPADRERGEEATGAVAERRKGVVMCERCRSVYSVWIQPEGRIYPISSHNNCSCDERNRIVIDEA